MLDESSCIKNPKSKRTKTFIGSKRPKMAPLSISNLILLSGTPTGGKYEELVTQVNLLGWNITYDEFLESFCIYFRMKLGKNKFGGDIVQPKITGYKNVHRLKLKLKELGCVFMKTDEVLDLPPQIEQVIKVDTIPQYKKMVKDQICEVDGIELVGDMATKQMLYLRQLSGIYNKNKYKALEDLIESTEDRIIIFYNFTEEFKRMKKLIKKPLSYVNGSGRDLKNYEKNNNSITLIQYQAGAMGLNLQKSNKIVYFSPPLSAELFEQSKKRTHRIGQEKTCFYYHLLTDKSIEYQIKKTLEQREDYNAKLFEKEK